MKEWEGLNVPEVKAPRCDRQAELSDRARCRIKCYEYKDACNHDCLACVFGSTNLASFLTWEEANDNSQRPLKASKGENDDSGKN